jgi:putative addiction module component (TIGR02574 family)
MLPDRETVLEQALNLSPEDRAFIIGALESSLDSGLSHEVDADSAHALSGDALLDELRRRSAAFRSGQASALPADEVLADLRRRQAGEKTA